MTTSETPPTQDQTVDNARHRQDPPREALAHLAIRAGAEARFIKTSRALAELAGGHADGTWTRRLRELARPAVLVLDDFAMRELTAAQADDLYELINERAGRSLILTSNRSPVDWYPLFPNPVVAESLLDRLINNSHQLLMNGPATDPANDPGAPSPQPPQPPARLSTPDRPGEFPDTPLGNYVIARSQPADLRKRPGPDSHWTGARSTRCSRPWPGHRWWNRPSTPPAARSRTPPGTGSPAEPSTEPPTGPATCSNSLCSGSAPNRARARDKLEMFGGRHRRPCPASTQPAGSRTPSSSCRPRRR